MDQRPPHSEPSPITANLRAILCGVLAAMGMWWRQPVGVVLFYRRISKVLGQIEQMLALFRAGMLQPVASGAPSHAVMNTASKAECLAVVAQAGRISRPLRLARAVKLPVMPEVAVGRIRTKRPHLKPEPLRIPLPRGVPTAARWAGFTKSAEGGRAELRLKCSDL